MLSYIFVFYVHVMKSNLIKDNTFENGVGQHCFSIGIYLV